MIPATARATIPSTATPTAPLNTSHLRFDRFGVLSGWGFDFDLDREEFLVGVSRAPPSIFRTGAAFFTGGMSTGGTSRLALADGFATGNALGALGRFEIGILALQASQKM